MGNNILKNYENAIDEIISYYNPLKQVLKKIELVDLSLCSE